MSEKSIQMGGFGCGCEAEAVSVPRLTHAHNYKLGRVHLRMRISKKMAAPKKWRPLTEKHICEQFSRRVCIVNKATLDSS